MEVLPKEGREAVRCGRRQAELHTPAKAEDEAVRMDVLLRYEHAEYIQRTRHEIPKHQRRSMPQCVKAGSATIAAVGTCQYPTCCASTARCWTPNL